MSAKLREMQLWMRNAVSLKRTRLFKGFTTGEFHGLFTVVGVYQDDTHSAPLAKYSSKETADDVIVMINHQADVPAIHN